MKQTFVIPVIFFFFLALSSCKEDMSAYFEKMGEMEALYPIMVNDKIGYFNSKGEIIWRDASKSASLLPKASSFWKSTRKKWNSDRLSANKWDYNLF